MSTGLVHRVACPFTPQLSLVLINRPQKDGTLSWRWYTVAVGEIHTCDTCGHKSDTHSSTSDLSGMARGRNKVNDTQADQIPYS